MHHDEGWTFATVVEALLNGDCTRLASLFVSDGDDPRTSSIVQWVDEGAFEKEPAALAEALTTACWLGAVPVARYLLERGVDPLAGDVTGMNALHWAANRGQLAAVELLVARGVPMELRSSHGGTVLGTTVWSALNEPKPDHLRIVAALLRFGADPNEVERPTGNLAIDAMLREALEEPARRN